MYTHTHTLTQESRCPTWSEPLRRYTDVKRCLSGWKELVRFRDVPGPSRIMIYLKLS